MTEEIEKQEADGLENFASISEKQQHLIEAFVQDGCRDKTEAFRKVYGESVKMISQAAWREFNKPKVKAALEEVRLQIAGQKIASMEEVAAVLSDITTGSLTDLISDNGGFDIRKLKSEKYKHLVSSVKFDKMTGTITVTGNSKIEAAKALARMLNYDRGNMKDTTENNVVVQIAIPAFGSGDAVDVQEYNELGKSLDKKGELE